MQFARALEVIFKATFNKDIGLKFWISLFKCFDQFFQLVSLPLALGITEFTFIKY